MVAWRSPDVTPSRQPSCHRLARIPINNIHVASSFLCPPRSPSSHEMSHVPLPLVELTQKVSTKYEGPLDRNSIPPWMSSLDALWGVIRERASYHLVPYPWRRREEEERGLIQNLTRHVRLAVSVDQFHTRMRCERWRLVHSPAHRCPGWGGVRLRVIFSGRKGGGGGVQEEEEGGLANLCSNSSPSALIKR